MTFNRDKLFLWYNRNMINLYGGATYGIVTIPV
jgi:hypothetical protein